MPEQHRSETLTEKTPPVDGPIDVGTRLRMLRAGAGLSIRALAEMSGLNVNTLSLIENGKTSPSVSTLQQLAQGLGIPVTEFFQTVEGDNTVVHQRRGQRPQAAFTHGVMEDLGAGMSRFGAEPLIVTLEAKADSGKNPDRAYRSRICLLPGGARRLYSRFRNIYLRARRQPVLRSLFTASLEEYG